MMMAVLDVDNDLCHIWAEEFPDTPGVPFVHIELKSWGVKELKLLEFVWTQFKLSLKNLGYKTVCSTIPNNDAKTIKFNQQFGMTIRFECAAYTLLSQEL